MSCKYCNPINEENEKLNDDVRLYHNGFNEWDLDIDYYNVGCGDVNCYATTIEIKFCPMCGIKL